MKCNGPLRMFAGSPILPTASDSDGHLIMRTPNESEVGILHGTAVIEGTQSNSPLASNFPRVSRHDR